jgi:hypothetical protein
MNSYTVRLDPEIEYSEITWHPIAAATPPVVDKLTGTERASTVDLIERNSETVMSDEAWLAAAPELYEINTNPVQTDYELTEALCEWDWDELVIRQNAEFKAKHGIDLNEPELEEIDKVALEEDSEENEDDRYSGKTKELVIRPKVIPFGGTLRVNHKTIKRQRPMRYQNHFRPIIIE